MTYALVAADVTRRRGSSPRTLLGRACEQAELDGLLGSVRAGMGAALVVRGAAGTGKTALLEYAAGAASDMQVVRVVGVESEFEVGYAGLHALLRPLAVEIEALPAPQRKALRTVFGLETGEVNRMAVGMATLTVLSAAASAGPVLCAVDDAQWLDRDSADALGFAVRRLHADGVGVLVAVLDGNHTTYAGVAELTLGPLARKDAAALLASVAGPLGRGVVDRVVAETGGNPLALIELGEGLSADQLAGQASVPEPLPIGTQLKRRFLAQVHDLPVATQSLLLVAAADTTGDPFVLFGAGRRLGFDIDAAEPAEAAGILVVGPRVAFRHPLIRSAVYHGATVTARRTAHAALAEAIDAATDPERRAWHRAAAGPGPDEAVAQELEKAAERARSRGGCAAAASFLTRAAQLSPDPSHGTARLLAAAEEELAAGEPTRAQRLVDQARPGLDSVRDHARAMAIKGQLLLLSSQPGRAASKLLEAAGAMRAIDIRAARAMLLDAMAAAVFPERSTEGADVGDVARAALDTPLPPGVTASAADLLLDGHAAFYTGDLASAAGRWKAALAELRADPGTWSLRNLSFGCWAALAIGDIEALGALSRSFEALARAEGAWFFITRALDYVALAELASGSIAAATAHAEEAREIDPARTDRPGVNAIAIYLAWSGKETDLRAEAERAAEQARVTGWVYNLSVTQTALALLELSRADYHAAWASLPRARNLYPAPFAVADYVEAAVRTQNAAAAEPVVNRYEQAATTAATPLMLGLLARCKALLATDEDAEPRYLESIVLLDDAKAVGHAARSRLVYGEWLRQARRRLDARQQLRLALTSFEAIGAGGFAERARTELLATGERVHKGKTAQPFELTPQEAQVARLAATGATNVEIAARLLISPNTVDYHLRKVYPKLGVSSRIALARKLGS